MGTDAVGLVEVRVGERWEPMLAEIWPNPGWREHNEAPFASNPRLPRHYGLFSVLADVRNRTGRGFVTMQKHMVPGYGEVEWPYDTDDGGHDPLEFIAEPRGIPDGAMDTWVHYCAGSGCHDATWFTLAELEQAPWDQTLYQQAVVIEEEYLQWQQTGEEPMFQSRSVGGPGMKIVNEVEYAAGVRGELQTAVDFRWKGKPLRQDIPAAWWATLSMMRLIAPDGDLSRVRLLVCFDS